MGTVASSESTNSQPLLSTAGSQFAGAYAGTPDERQEQDPASPSAHQVESGSPPRPTPPIPPDLKDGIASHITERLASMVGSGYGLASEPLHQALSHLDAATTIQALAISSPVYQQHLRQAAASLPPPSHISLPSNDSPSSPAPSNPKSPGSATAASTEAQPEDDGYKWRKYGRKSVKGNQFPRSYYKCTFPGCTVKKQVETTIKNGNQVLHTTYNGKHNHDAPQVIRLNADDQTTFKNSVISEFLGAASAMAADTIATMASGNPTTTTSAGTMEQTTTTIVNGSHSLGGASSSSTPRLVVETKIDVDHLDDGYHWRKYGQKNVKGSPYPRSYYKCTEKDCPVKKQVEQNGTHIINTYEGTHNHEAPGLNGSSRKRRRRKKKKDEPATTGCDDDEETRLEEDDQTQISPRKRPKAESVEAVDKYRSIQQHLNSLNASSSSILSLISASTSPSLSPTTSPSSDAAASSSSSSGPSSLLRSSSISVDAITRLLAKRRRDPVRGDEPDNGRNVDHSESASATSSCPTIVDNSPSLSSLYSILTSPPPSEAASAYTSAHSSDQTYTSATSTPLTISALPLSPPFASNINSPSLQALLASSAGMLSLSPLLHDTAPALPSATEPTSSGTSVSHHDGCLPDAHPTDKPEEANDGPLPPDYPSLPSLGSAPLVASSSVSASQALKTIILPLAAAMAASFSQPPNPSAFAPNAGISPTPSTTPAKIPVSLLASDSTATVAMLLINEDLTLLD